MQYHKTKFIEKNKMRTKDRQTKVSKFNNLWGNTISTLGTVKLNCQINSAQYQLEFHNVDKLATSHFGLKDSLKMKLLKVNKESTKSMPAVSSKNNFLVRTKICLMTILASYQQFTQ